MTAGRSRSSASRARALLALLLAAATLAALPAGVAADDRPTLRVDAPTTPATPGDEITVTIIQSAPVATTGAQINVIFDRKLLELTDFRLASGFANVSAIFQYGNADKGTSGDKAAAIERANKVGYVENAAGFLLPGSGTIPAGENPFLELTFYARGGDGGTAKILLLKGSMIDETGQPLGFPNLVDGAMTVQAGVAPSREPTTPGPDTTAAPGESGVPLESAAGEPLPSPSSPVDPVLLSVAPTSLELKKDDTARVFLVAKADGDISSVTITVSFDPEKLELTGVEPGPGWGDGTLIGGDNGGIAAAIATANTTGVLPALGPFYPPGAKDLPYGETWFASLLVKAKADGQSTLSIDKGLVLGIDGENLVSVIDPASQTAAAAAGIELDPTLVIPMALLLLIVLAVVVLHRTGRIPERVRRRWPYYVSLAFGLVPVALFTALIVMLVANAAPVVSSPGIPALFGADFVDTRGVVTNGFSLFPGLFGTILITVIAAAVALPISLALAIVAVDFPMGPVGRVIRPLIGVLSGVPPIVYAVSVPAFVAAFLIPKLAGNMTFDTFDAVAIGADPATWPPPSVPFSAGSYPWSSFGPSSTLMGGILVGLFLIPFVTPLFVDALRDVPRAAREASIALGANQTYTLRRVVLPGALPAIGTASILAILKAMGDAVIVLFAVGTAAVIPSPPFDVLERASGIGAWGASLIGSFEVLDASCNPQACAVGYTSALVLMGIAGIVVVTLSALGARSRRRRIERHDEDRPRRRLRWRMAGGQFGG